MKATYKLERPGEIEATITITMPVKDWEHLAGQLEKQWPSWKLSSIITQAVRDANRVIYPDCGKAAD